MNKILVEYIHDKRGHRGAVVAFKVDDSHFDVSWSLCNRKFDKFSKSKAIEVAMARRVPEIVTPKAVVDLIGRMRQRATKYFKGCSFLTEIRF